MSQEAQAATINYYRQGNLNRQYLFLTVLGTGKSKIKVPANLVPSEGVLYLHRAGFLLYTNIVKREKEISLMSVHTRSLTSFMRAPPL